MNSKLYLFLSLSLLVLLSGCELDNYEEPKSTLTGQVIFEDLPINVRSNGVELELWQPGFDLFTKIPVYVNQDGTFSTKVFDGDYKLTMLRGAPWVYTSDTINVSVRGNAEVDVQVSPYYIFENVGFSRQGASEITADFNLRQVTDQENLEFVRVYLGRTTILDQNINIANATLNAADIDDVSGPFSMGVTIPASLDGRNYVFARLGLKVRDVPELLYSSPQKIMLD
ncbi:DUF3823 domain-containing protein [Algoriphagus sp. NG3]|uniref:DUF3823 domain-containing protein n=1 Tax=Algoriphagus sp. NG3 TaxID=3097546 RepID=UPI002A8090F0|nr:DUF3823 domain-containing protein [Algoriphagus sp. NG3]WPR77252.1 DUF3823 domain-containing protein [Algoriphagus sp. NG3]